MCVNYGGRAEMLDAAVAIAKDAMRKKIKPDALTEKSIISIYTRHKCEMLTYF